MSVIIFLPGAELSAPIDPETQGAVYARFSDSDLQTASSILQQADACRVSAQKDGNVILDENIFADEGCLGSTFSRTMPKRQASNSTVKPRSRSSCTTSRA